MNKKMKIALIALCVVFVGIFSFSAYKIISTLSGYKKAEQTYTNMSSQFVSVASPAPSDESAPAESEIVVEPLEISPINVDFNSLLEINGETVGWIYSPGTPINYPIVHTTDNFYYLDHLLDDEYNANGTIFVDCVCMPDFSDKNTLVYGHNMNDGSMFASLRSYRLGDDPDYYTNHPNLYISTPDKSYRVELVAGLITTPESYVYAYKFDEVEQFINYVDMVKAESTFKSDVEVGPDDKLVTLSTCTYEVDDGRYVVIGKLVEIAPPEG